MPLIWTLKKWLAVERDIYRPVELQALIREKTGVELSIQSVSALINGNPGALRIQTIQVLCNTLDCELSDFCQIVPDPVDERRRVPEVDGSSKKLYGNQKQRKSKKGENQHQESIFPDPNDFRNQA